MNYLYLCINLACLSIPLLMSFHPKFPFHKEWKLICPGMLIGAMFFIAWDIYFTKIGIWGFNPAYIYGFYIYNIPIEEVLFFVCIPYASLFTYFALKNIFPSRLTGFTARWISYCLIFGLIAFGLLHYQRAYTFTSFLACGLLLVYAVLYSRINLLRDFFWMFLFILFPFFLSNGILTGSFIEDQVVWYNDAENLGIRMGTIPVEDTFYGMALLLINVLIYEHQKLKNN